MSQQGLLNKGLLPPCHPHSQLAQPVDRPWKRPLLPSKPSSSRYEMVQRVARRARMRKLCLYVKCKLLHACDSGYSRPAARALNRIPQGTQKELKLLIKLTSAALLLVYAKPARGCRRKLAVLAVATTWLLQGYVVLLPASNNSMNAMIL